MKLLTERLRPEAGFPARKWGNRPRNKRIILVQKHLTNGTCGVKRAGWPAGLLRELSGFR